MRGTRGGIAYHFHWSSPDTASTPLSVCASPLVAIREFMSTNCGQDVADARSAARMRRRHRALVLIPHPRHRRVKIERRVVSGSLLPLAVPTGMQRRCLHSFGVSRSHMRHGYMPSVPPLTGLMTGTYDRQNVSTGEGVGYQRRHQSDCSRFCCRDVVLGCCSPMSVLLASGQ